MTDESLLVKLPESGQVPKVKLVSPSPHGYLVLALEIDRRPLLMHWWESSKKRDIIERLKAYAKQLSAGADIVDATVFKTWMQPPGRAKLLRDRNVPHVYFDVVLLIETTDTKALKALQEAGEFRALLAALKQQTSKMMVTEGENVRRMGDVDHERDGIFLFNFFYADSLEQNLQVWEYTAGWFQDQTGLDNSTLLLPKNDDVPYTVISHCRWDGPGNIIPKLLFEPTFKSYVLKHFAANDTAAIPILYRLA